MSVMGSPRDKDLKISLLSFGFKYGLPKDADIMMDVRFLQNPHWVEDLKPMSGLEKPVGDYIADDPAFGDFVENFMKMLVPLLPRYAEAGKSEFTIAIGCTGGRHRSVFSVDTLARLLREQGFKPDVRHRDLKV